MIFFTAVNGVDPYTTYNMSNFVIVSNRLPVSVSRVEGKLVFSVSSGGLATAMSSLTLENQVWIGWPGIASDDLTASEKAQITKELRKYNCFPVHLTSQQIADFYEGYSNDTLWPLFHYFQSYAQYSDAYWNAYRAVNRKYLQAVKKQAAPDATIWIHDYHLMLLPSMVRSALPDSKIGFFLHIPYPSYELYRLLPERKEIIEGLLGADLLGFHIYDYARHFISSCNHLLGVSSEQGIIEYQGRRVKVDAFPIGIDYKKFRSTVDSPETKHEMACLAERYGDQKIIVSIDRLDYSKGILKRLEAFELFLREHPEYLKKVTLLMVAVPSRTEVETYKLLRDSIEQTVSRINGQFGTTDWMPISYQFQNLPFEHIVALYAKAEVALVTPIRDGMNLVAKEYVASKRRRTGVLILSEMAGAANELTEALQVNPNNVTAIAQSIYQALTMKRKEQKQRLDAMQARISEYTVQEWGSDFITQLERVSDAHRGAMKKRLKQQDITDIISGYSNAKSRLVLLDYDGTLHGFSTSIRASAVQPSIRIKAQLRRISEQAGTTLCIISGRPRKVLEMWFGSMPNIVLIAEHGAWIKTEGKWEQNTEQFDKSTIVDAMKRYASRTAGSLVEEKDFAVVWHYRRVAPELAYIRNNDLRRELKTLTDDSSLGVYNGNKIIEVKPKSIHKGVIATQLAAKHDSEFIFCAGDDYTDEHMFKALPSHARTVKVGYGTTHAKHQVAKLERILSIIEQMSKTKPN